ncbi:hypothetical protein [Tranquillimonas alkanivorans]|uniref:Curlin associated repeat-containing protein n=1 Tax=Tranquillimonas alkanivorans TaxID=441119 RepID=A0A1I5SZ64_9RHOB|nr:hypothetical protein [Tranquillimonas alkanivorans]SFP76008.1 Curlin associated repeat-containing protein [Tranquillimonas alkanivorans]
MFTRIATAATLALSLGFAAPAAAGGSVTFNFAPRGDGARTLGALLSAYALTKDLENEAEVRQRGEDNTAGTRQRGRGNRALIEQDGAGHEGSISQTGNGNLYGLFQKGRGTTAHVKQRGDGRAGLTFQYGW